MSGPLNLRIFISSPGDVQDERNLARQLIKDELPVDGSLIGKVSLLPFSWDDPHSAVPLLATMTPQEAVNRGLGRPADCEIVVVIFWSRMGTPLPDSHRKPNGECFLSGTEWEFEDARGAGRDVLLYRRSEEPVVGLRDPNRDEKARQFELVDKFFEQFRNADGSFNTGYETYSRPGEFKDKLEQHLRVLIRQRLDREPSRPSITPEPPTKRDWRSPYPGLRAFTEAEADIFFGRAREIDELLARLRDPTCRFLAIVGDSGTGKSSLLHAGLLPRLRAGALPGSDHWRFASFTPAGQMGDPLLALTTALRDALPAAMRPAPRARSRELADDEAVFRRVVDKVLTSTPEAAELVLVIDQFEELFALGRHRPFIELLGRAAVTPKVRILATMRADFLPQALRHTTLVALLRAGSFPVGAPTTLALIDMIRRPADRAGAKLPDDLLDALLADAGNQPGALPLVAFALSELWPEAAEKSDLTLAAYESIGRLGGAIGRRAAALDLDVKQLYRLFPDLVQINPEGIATRKQVDRSTLADADLLELIDTLVEERFLRPGSDLSLPIVELAHEILLTGWPALAIWLGERGPHMRARRELDSALARWIASETNEQELIPPGSRLREAQELLLAAPDLVANPALRKFIETSVTRAEHIDHEAQATLRRETRRLMRLAEEQYKAGDAVTSILLGIEVVDRAQLIHDKSALSEALAALSNVALSQRETTIFRGHEDTLWCVSYSPDAKRILTTSCDNTARIWDFDTGNLLQVLTGHTATIYFGVFSPDGNRVITVSGDNTTRIWDATSGQELQILREHLGPIYYVAHSADGRLIATASGDKTARLWDAISGQPIQILRGHEQSLYCISISRDGSLVLTGSWDHTARLWDAFSGEEIHNLRGHSNVVTSVQFSPDETTILTGSWDGSYACGTPRQERNALSHSAISQFTPPHFLRITDSYSHHRQTRQHGCGTDGREN
ncbi:MAG: WD40 repeat domain-containing protein [Geminicoccaceae bacterium]